MKKYLFYLIVIILITACDTQRAFIVNPPNVNCFKYENEENFKIALNGMNLNLQSNHVINNRFGIATTFYGGVSLSDILDNSKENKGYYIGAEIAGIYYKYFNRSKYFEIQGGYGYCNNQIDKYRPDPYRAIGLHGGFYSCSSNTDYHKLYVQPSFFIVGKIMSIGFASKLNLVYFNQYNYKFAKETDDGNDGYTTSGGIEGITSFKHKFCFVYEPVINIKFGSIFYIQFVGALANNIHTGSSNDYIDDNNPYFKPNFYTFPNPQYSYLKMNIGFEFKLGKDKKPIFHEPSK